jgi:hypothetical protein
MHGETIIFQEREIYQMLPIQDLRAYRGSRGTSSFMLNLGTIWEWST